MPDNHDEAYDRVENIVMQAMHGQACVLLLQYPQTRSLLHLVGGNVPLGTHAQQLREAADDAMLKGLGLKPTLGYAASSLLLADQSPAAALGQKAIRNTYGRAVRLFVQPEQLRSLRPAKEVLNWVNLTELIKLLDGGMAFQNEGAVPLIFKVFNRFADNLHQLDNAQSTWS